MNKNIRTAFNELRDRIVDSLDNSIVDKPFICLTEDKGWSIGVGLVESDARFYRLIPLMKSSLVDGWEDAEMIKGIKEVRQLLSSMESQYRKYKDKESPDI